MTRATRLTFALVALSLALSTKEVAADDAQPVYIASNAGSAIRVRLSAGTVTPCDASEDRMLLDTWLQPNTYVTIASNAPDLCFQHTSESFPDSEWQPAEQATRPAVCRRGSCRLLPGEPVTFAVR